MSLMLVNLKKSQLEYTHQEWVMETKRQVKDSSLEDEVIFN